MDKFSKIILGYPFSGSLYAFFQNTLEPGRPAERMFSNSYYRTLFGDNYKQVTDLTLTFTTLFDKIIISPADARIPDYEKYYNNGFYENPELGVVSSWNDFLRVREELNETIEKDLEDTIIAQILKNVPDWAKSHILLDIRYNMYLSSIHTCPIICSSGHQTIINRLTDMDRHQNQNNEALQKGSIEMVKHYLDLTGMIFNPVSLEELYYIKNDREFRDYSKSFIEIMNNFHDKENPREELLLLINESMNKEQLAKKTSGIFNVASVLLSIGGFIPIIGPWLSGTALASTGASAGLSRYAKKQNWYEIGSHVQKITSKRQIQETIDKELKHSL
ncbi:hypothetical protein [Bacillus sp. dmp10]|uniref:hypothetical protein n=1 Tax=Bacillus sp. dmp10 TaxID=2293321 RepID=UPI000E2EE5C7|nr:hypothetical protein DZB83_18965 [Bacillus sp. dmp10]